MDYENVGGLLKIGRQSLSKKQCSLLGTGKYGTTAND